MPSQQANLPYFAFGSNLDEQQMKNRCPQHQTIGVACLDNHTLWFPRRSSTWDGGGASIKEAQGKKVWGYLYALSTSDWAQLDKAEGFKPDGTGAHTKRQVTAVNDRGQTIDAIAYVARIETETKPSVKYMETILRGARARGLPEEWIRHLESLVPRQV